MEVRSKLSDRWPLNATPASLFFKERDPLVYGIDIPIRCREVCDMVLEPLGHQRLDERLFLRLLLRTGVRDVVRCERV